MAFRLCFCLWSLSLTHFKTCMDLRNIYMSFFAMHFLLYFSHITTIWKHIIMLNVRKRVNEPPGNTKGHCTIDLLFDCFALVCFANKNKNWQLSYSWFQTSQTGGQQYSDTYPFSIPWNLKLIFKDFAIGCLKIWGKAAFTLVNH